ncbi:hypothetical protein [Cyclobacterium sp.]|uniref:hypothetical protein n=1 Tax=Cyclobacterium sp. TaxID=1966343 RepID=UPI0019C2EE94|nr:hypothetical protein [Cyclobacterium sp.]MBD3627970.1 hypothetical protein [Cyclobacterium sp.]
MNNLKSMTTYQKYLDFGVRYGIPLTIIMATLAMKKAKGLGNLAVFALVTPTMLGYLYSLKKAKEALKNYPEAAK